MTTNLHPTCDSVNEKLSGYIDGELTQQDTQLVRVHLQRCESCQKVLNDLLANRGHLKGTLLPNAQVAADHAELNDKPAKFMQWIGWSLLILGSLVLAIFIGWEFLADESVPAWARIASFSVFGGTVLLLIAVLRQRLISRKTDKYKKVKL